MLTSYGAASEGFYRSSPVRSLGRFEPSRLDSIPRWAATDKRGGGADKAGATTVKWTEFAEKRAGISLRESRVVSRINWPTGLPIPRCGSSHADVVLLLAGWPRATFREILSSWHQIGRKARLHGPVGAFLFRARSRPFSRGGALSRGAARHHYQRVPLCGSAPCQ